MKKKSSFVIFSLLFLTSTIFAYAGEAGMEKILPTTLSQDAGSGSVLEYTVKGNGELIARPGQTFARGGNYEGIQLPYLISNPEPIQYPRWALKQGWEGRVVVAIEVLLDGTVGRQKVMESSGHKLLDAAAQKALQAWKFHPAVKNGTPIVECISIPIVFEINEQ